MTWIGVAPLGSFALGFSLAELEDAQLTWRWSIGWVVWVESGTLMIRNC